MMLFDILERHGYLSAGVLAFYLQLLYHVAQDSTWLLQLFSRAAIWTLKIGRRPKTCTKHRRVKVADTRIGALLAQQYSAFSTFNRFAHNTIAYESDEFLPWCFYEPLGWIAFFCRSAFAAEKWWPGE